MAIARMVLGNWRQKLVSARGNDKKSAVFDTKQAFSDKKTPFWGLRMPVRCGCLVPQRPLPSFLRSFSNDPPPSRSIRNRRRRRPDRLLGHDRSKE
jgi:hypothetical protein